MAGEWETVPLGELYDFSSGLSKPRSEFGSGYPFLAFKDVFYSFFVPKELSQLVNSTDQERARCSVRRGDVFLTRTSETMNELGMSCVALRDIPNATFNGFTKRLRPKIDDKVVPEYAGYYFRSSRFRQSVTAMSSMSTRASLNNEMLARLSIDLPPLQEQVAIGHILGTLDDKIELNRRMSETLEAMTRALFKSWFVDFDPVRAKMDGRDPGLPKHIADLFPDCLVDSELGEIPEGWETKPLDEVAHFQNGLALQKFRPKPDEARLPVVKIAQLRSGKADRGEWATADLKPECIIDDGDVVFSWSGSLLVRVWCGGRAALNQHLFKVTSENYPRWFFSGAILSHLPEFRRIAAGKATTMGHIQRRHLTDAICVVPTDNVLAVADPLFSGLVDRSVANETENSHLVKLRDTLLPKLVSRELRLRDAERFIAEAPP